MKRIAPQVIKECNVFIEGEGHFGVTASVQLPNITQVMIDENGALKGKSGTGIFEPLELNFKLQVIKPDLYRKLIADNAFAQLPIVIKESIHQAQEPGFPLQVIAKGDIEAVELSEDATGNTREASIKMHCSSYLLSQNGQELITYDRANCIFAMNGIDLMAQVRSDLSM